MGAWNLDDARTFLKAWMQAELAVTTGQNYTIGTRILTRANLKEIAARVEFWRGEVARLENGGTRKRVFRLVPLDL